MKDLKEMDLSPFGLNLKIKGNNSAPLESIAQRGVSGVNL